MVHLQEDSTGEHLYFVEVLSLRIAKIIIILHCRLVVTHQMKGRGWRQGVSDFSVGAEAERKVCRAKSGGLCLKSKQGLIKVVIF